MNKKIYKGYELIKAIHDGEIEQGKSIEVYEYYPFMKDKKIATIKFVDNKLKWIAGEFDTSYLFDDYNYFMVLEDNTEEIEELKIFDDDGETERDIKEKINELVRVVNKLRK